MMMLKRLPTKRELLERILGIDKSRDGAARRIERELEQLYKSYFANVKAIINKKELKAGDAATLESTTKQMNQLTNILEQSGFSNVAHKYVAEFEGLTRSALDYYTAFGAKPSLAGISPATLDAYIRFTETELHDIIDRKLVAPVKSALLQVNFAGSERSDVYAQVSALEESLSIAQVVTTVDDAFASFQRAVLVETATALKLDIYQYLGPDDSITSDQCEEMLHVNLHGVEGMLYKDEITVDLHENLTRNPLIGGGHPRCRHHWSPVTEDYAKAQGFEVRE